ncbi:hypothetical protein HK102_001927, partial [Quaeritorhiza haematococci]
MSTQSPLTLSALNATSATSKDPNSYSLGRIDSLLDGAPLIPLSVTPTPGRSSLGDSSE